MPDLPPQMVEAAARFMWEKSRNGYENFTAAPWDELGDDLRDWCCEEAASFLTAALSVCEVREEPGLRQANTERPELNGDLWQDDRRPDPYDIAAEFEPWRDVEPPWSCSRIRRLHITTPAEEADR